MKDEEEEGVWGYLIPLDGSPQDQKTMVLKQRSACQMPEGKTTKAQSVRSVDPKEYTRQEEEYEKSKTRSIPAGGYILGRHPECGK